MTQQRAPSRQKESKTDLRKEEREIAKNVPMGAKDKVVDRTICVEAPSPGLLLHTSLDFT